MAESLLKSSASSGGTRASLLARVCERDSEAWNELVELYGPLVAYWCQHSQLDGHATADCVQDVFLAVHRKVEAYHPQSTNGSFRAWLWTITRNKVRDHLRKSHWPAPGGTTALGNLQQLSDPRERPNVHDLSDDEPSGPDELRSLVTRALGQIKVEFTSRTWAIFERSLIDQLPTPLVAEQFQVTTANVRQIRSRILRRLREQLGDT